MKDTKLVLEKIREKLDRITKKDIKTDPDQQFIPDDQVENNQSIKIDQHENINQQQKEDMDLNPGLSSSSDIKNTEEQKNSSQKTEDLTKQQQIDDEDIFKQVDELDINIDQQESQNLDAKSEDISEINDIPNLETNQNDDIFQNIDNDIDLNDLPPLEGEDLQLDDPIEQKLPDNIIDDNQDIPNIDTIDEQSVAENISQQKDNDILEINDGILKEEILEDDIFEKDLDLDLQNTQDNTIKDTDPITDQSSNSNITESDLNQESAANIDDILPQENVTEQDIEPEINIQENSEEITTDPEELSDISQIIETDNTNLENQLDNQIDNNVTTSEESIKNNLIEEELDLNIEPEMVDDIDSDLNDLEKELDTGSLNIPLGSNSDNIISEDSANKIKSSLQELTNNVSDIASKNPDLKESRIEEIFEHQLKTWLDTHLPNIVGDIVKEEIDKLINKSLD